MKKKLLLLFLFCIQLQINGATSELKYVGMPVGGICTGQVYLGGDGQLWYWDIFNVMRINPGGPGDKFYLNPMTQEKTFENGFSLSIKEGSKKFVRPLNQQGFQTIAFTGEYPIGKVHFSDKYLPVEVDLQAFSPFIPTDEENSGLPVTILEYTVTNHSSKKVMIALNGWLQNNVCYQTAIGKEGKHINQIEKADNYTRLVCTTSNHLKATQADWGSMCLTLLGKGRGSAQCAENKGLGNYEIRNEKTKSQVDLGKKIVGGVVGKTILEPSESKTFTFLLSWYFPNIHLWNGRHNWKNLKNLRHYYSSKFTDASDVSNYVLAHPGLIEDTKKWHATWYDSSLPKWFLDRTFTNLSTLATTAAVRFDDITDLPENEGRFYTYEGVYLGEGSCTHVTHYEQAIGRVFPNLAKQQREQVDLGLSFNKGIIGYRGEFSQSGHHDGRGYAVDGQAGSILRIYREHTMSNDHSFLKKNWPKIKEAMSYMINQDKEKTGKADGILEGAQYNTLDRIWYGKITWLSGMYAAALRASEMMAKEMKDKQFESICHKIANLAYQTISKQLFNGEYFIQVVDSNHLNAPNTNIGCHIDQLLGQYWASQLRLKEIVPKKQIHKALQSIMRYNFVENYQAYLDQAEIPIKRWYAQGDEKGLIVCSFPYGGADKAAGMIHNEWEKLVIGYFSEIFTGQEHCIAATLLSEGMIKDAYKIEKALCERYSANKRNPYNEIEYGNHYTRALSGYAPFVSACGFYYDGPNHCIGFHPINDSPFFKAAFITTQAWGNYSQTLSEEKAEYFLVLKYGTLKITQLELDIPKRLRKKKINLSLNGKMIDRKISYKDGRLKWGNKTILLKRNDQLKVCIK